MHLNTAKPRLCADTCSMEGGTALIVTAHPDDEAMFCGPTIQRLQQDGTSIHVLCLSTGVDCATADPKISLIRCMRTCVCMRASVIAQGTLRDLAAYAAMSYCVRVKCSG